MSFTDYTVARYANSIASDSAST